MEKFVLYKKMGNGFKMKISTGVNRDKKTIKALFEKSDAQASLEFILIVPFIILIILAVSHFGIMVYQKNIMEQAAREGARIISTTNSNKKALECIRKACSDFKQDCIDVKIIPEDSSLREAGDMVEVHIFYSSGGIGSILKLFTGDDNLIKVKSNMRMECY